jgi:hypothetical protein
VLILLFFSLFLSFGDRQSTTEGILGSSGDVLFPLSVLHPSGPSRTVQYAADEPTCHAGQGLLEHGYTHVPHDRRNYLLAQKGPAEAEIAFPSVKELNESECGMIVSGVSESMNTLGGITLFENVSVTAYSLLTADNRWVRHDLLLYRTLPFEEETRTYKFSTQHLPILYMGPCEIGPLRMNQRTMSSPSVIKKGL